MKVHVPVALVANWLASRGSYHLDPGLARVSLLQWTGRGQPGWDPRNCAGCGGKFFAQAHDVRTMCDVKCGVEQSAGGRPYVRDVDEGGRAASVRPTKRIQAPSVRPKLPRVRQKLPRVRPKKPRCTGCGRALPFSVQRRKTCSPACRVAAHRAGASSRTGHRKCEWCGEMFAAVRQMQKCCGRECQSHAYRRRVAVARMRQLGRTWAAIATEYNASVAVVKRWALPRPATSVAKR